MNDMFTNKLPLVGHLWTDLCTSTYTT